MQECRREWMRQGEEISFDALIRLAAESEAFQSVIDPDFDEDRVMMRRASDYFTFELKEFGSVNRDGLSLRQAPGANDVGANAWFEQVRKYYNLGFDAGDGQKADGNYASAFIYRAAVVNSQVNAD